VEARCDHGLGERIATVNVITQDIVCVPNGVLQPPHDRSVVAEEVGYA